MIRSSYSQLSRFALCPMQWWLMNRWKPKQEANALVIGQAFHAAAARAYAQRDGRAGMSYLTQLCASVSQDSAIAPSLHTLMASFKLFAEKVLPGDLQTFKVLAVEKSAELELAGSGVVVAVIDLVLQHIKSGNRYIVDHKYKADFDEMFPERDDQSTIYGAALYKEYGTILPTIYNVVRKPVYKQQINETAVSFGIRSLQKMQDEEKSFVYNPLAYQSRFFVRQIYSRGALHMQGAIERMRSQMAAMEWLRDGKGKAWINPGDNCRWCPARLLCPVEDSLVADRFFVRKGQSEQAT